MGLGFTFAFGAFVEVEESESDGFRRVLTVPVEEDDAPIVGAECDIDDNAEDEAGGLEPDADRFKVRCRVADRG